MGAGGSLRAGLKGRLWLAETEILHCKYELFAIDELVKAVVLEKSPVPERCGCLFWGCRLVKGVKKKTKVGAKNWDFSY